MTQRCTGANWIATRAVNVLLAIFALNYRRADIEQTKALKQWPLY